MSSQVILRAEQVSVRRRTGWTLTVPTLEVARGESLAILGPNGAGKSTLLHLLALLEPVDTGRILLNGVVVRPSDLHARRQMAVVMQEPLMLDGSVERNVMLGMRLHGVARHERDQRAHQWMAQTGIAHLATRRARTLSGGEQRRVSLARAFALKPAVLFLDEPFSGLDAPTRRAMLHELPGWLAASGCATVLVTHDRDDALHLADRVAMLFNGAVRQFGSATEVFSHPADAELAAFVGFENQLVGAATPDASGTCSVRIGTVVLQSDACMGAGQVRVLIHPEQVLLAQPGGQSLPSGTTLPARVAAIAPEGGRLRVCLDAGVPLIAVAARAQVAQLGLRPGSPVTAILPPSAVHLLPS